MCLRSDEMAHLKGTHRLNEEAGKIDVDDRHLGSSNSEPAKRDARLGGGMEERQEQLNLRIAELNQIVEKKRKEASALQAKCDQLSIALDERFRELATLTELLRHTEASLSVARDDTGWAIAVLSAVLDIHNSSSPALFERLSKRMSFRSLKKELKNKGLFDSDGYLSLHPDVKESGLDPLYHYVSFGLSEGRKRSG